MQRFLRFWVTLTFVFLSSCAHGAQKRIVFVGNSLTGVNNLPGLFQFLANSQGESPYVEAHLEFGKDLAFHAQNDELKTALSKNWDYVVLQEYSVVPLQTPKAFAESVSKLKAMMKSPSAKLILFQNWAVKDSAPGTMAQLEAVYASVAHANGAKVVAVGAAVERLKRETSLQVFTDDKHPTPIVSYLAGLLFLKEFYQVSPLRVDHTGADMNTHYSYHGPAPTPSLVDLDAMLGKQVVDPVQRIADEN